MSHEDIRVDRIVLSRKQLRALLLMEKHRGVTDTLHIAGNTGKSLNRWGLVFIHRTGDKDEGTSISYELSTRGKQWLNHYHMLVDKGRERSIIKR